jgi:hypothetical protein
MSLGFTKNIIKHEGLLRFLSSPLVLIFSKFYLSIEPKTFFTKLFAASRSGIPSSIIL